MTIEWPSQYSRPVSFSERSFFGGPTLQKQALSVQYVFEGTGALSLDDLRSAVAEATKANPGARLVLRGCLKGLRWVAEGPIPTVSALPAWPDDNELPNALSKAFDVKRGPTCEVLLLNFPKTRIVFRCFHGVMDGRGLIHFAEEVFRALRGEKCKGAPSTLTDSELIRELVGDKFRPMRPLKFQPPVDRSSSDQRGVHGLRLSLEGHVPSLPAKIAAGLIQLAEKRPDKTISFMTPVDIRYYKPGLRSTGNLSSPIYFEGRAGQDWNAIQEVIMKALLEKEALRREPSEAWVAWLPLWCTKIMIRAFEYLQRRKGRYIFSSYISHINLPKKAAFSGGGFQCETAFVTPPQTEFFPLGISALTLEGSTQITIFGPRYILGESQLKEVADCLKAVLK